ncbi:MAG: NAD(P)/FAD-dependent oxidoreductase [Chloroherpetonaceae bacterium]|nr:NAD(P)/FAD-dependent oxidoreductase [Chloroherpetonaceae bacterium]MCS7212134.1 NAD(P)/FAD-dependent oxidoreductase [Chloroherpetonaceae bacterium]MDW8018729.1 NAD(P)/FAD-dependent oxidoreductase [Chloroherpetonaceae bacterium]MDW8465914.1 NAD(P)/FAD-dependent oxidoreductase [Chloroherpetonaceae bacterium]
MVREVIVIGAGFGGLSAACLLAKHGLRPLLVEAAAVPGGCASSYLIKRGGKKFLFEAGATTIVGLDPHQPLRHLADALEVQFPVVEINPAMMVHIGSKKVVRYKDRRRWVEECYQKFFAGTSCTFEQVRAFWTLIFELSDFVWLVAERNRAFPPRTLQDVWELYQQNPLSDFPKLRYLFQTTLSTIQHYGLDKSPNFVRFCNEQLMITAQATADKVALLYAAPCLAYTNSSNYYAYGGMLAMAETLVEKYKQMGGEILYRTRITRLEQDKHRNYVLWTDKGERFMAKTIVSNATIWDMADLAQGRLKPFFERLTRKFAFGWGAVTMSIAVENTLPDDLALHHQIILDESIPHCKSNSFFVSLSMPDDVKRQPEGTRLLAISTHTQPEIWLSPECYAEKKADVETFLLEKLEQHLPGFQREKILFKTVSTPKSWQEWVYRKQGRVGGIPNTLEKSIFELQGAETDFEGLYLVGDTVYPGQGIAGVTLSGQNAVHRILQRMPAPVRQTSYLGALKEGALSSESLPVAR